LTGLYYKRSVSTLQWSVTSTETGYEVLQELERAEGLEIHMKCVSH
jgi:hypothetical protein